LEEDNAESERVTVVPGDLIVEEKKLPLPAVVKIDVEVMNFLSCAVSGIRCQGLFVEWSAARFILRCCRLACSPVTL